MTGMKRVVIESPCAGNFDLNTEYLREALLDALSRSEAPIASHGLLAFSGVLDDADTTQRFVGMEAGFVWTAVAHIVAVYKDLGISPGMQRGIAVAHKHGIHVEYRNLNEAAMRRIKALQSRIASRTP
jgi:hypothetical protein